ncbi:MAG: hypothetical protein EON47_12650, partial [Acetobacteraceae bacterium]
FARRHIGPGPDDITAMLQVVGAASLEEMAGRTIPASIRQAGGADHLQHGGDVVRAGTDVATGEFGAVLQCREFGEDAQDWLSTKAA